ncbi:protein FAM216A-like [Mastomys coucha]|uniref:protein FAM216A-like n=1 Tax=Mastomys coucha TaxID=35658 RepID=UPI0012626B1B|nr:protein FAM216A-like [Mastomys coucha]
MPSRFPGVAGPTALARTEGGEGSAGHSYHPNSKGTGEQHKADRIKEGHRVYSHIAKLQELWKTAQIQTIHIPKLMTDASFLKYMHLFHHGSQKPGVLTHHRGHMSPRYAQKQHSPCTAWRHHLEREDSLSTAAETPEMIIHSLWRPLRHKEGLKIGYASKTRCKSLKVFRRPRGLFLLPVSPSVYQAHMNEEAKEEDLLNKRMQSMSIQEQGSPHANLTV